MIPRVVPVDVGGDADGTATCRAPGREDRAADDLGADEPVTEEVGVVTDMIATSESLGKTSQSSTCCRPTCCRNEWGPSVLTGITDYCSQPIKTYRSGSRSLRCAGR